MMNRKFLAATAAAVSLVSSVGCGLEEGGSGPRPTEVIRSAAEPLSTDGQACLSVQRGAAGGVADANLWASSPRWNDSASTRLTSGSSATAGLRRALVRYDLSAVPAGATVLSANLSLYQLYRTTGGTSVSLFRVTAPWSESSVTWKAFNNAFDPAPLGSFTTLTATNGWRTVDIASLAQGWVDGTLPNHGVVLDEVASTYTEYRSSESASTSERPKLELCYVTCNDGIQNGHETGVDCGGPRCAPCGVAPEGTSVLVQILDAAGAPLAGAAVTTGGSVHATDGAGRLMLDDLPPGRFVARVEAYGFAPASVVLDLSAGAHTGTEARLLPLGAPIPFDAAQGATLARGDVRVVIPPGALVDENGEPVTGPVEATVVPFNPTAQSLATLPGPLEGTTAASGEVVGLDSVMMAEVSLWQGGNRLELAPGATATLELPVPDAEAAGVAVGATIPAWWFDLDGGLWREEGAGTIQPSSADPSRLAWVVEVHHFTWWNCDKPWTEKRCFQVTVVDPNGVPLPGQVVGAVGTSYEGSSTPKTTDAAGQACIDIMNGGTAQAYLGSYEAPLGSLWPLYGVGPASACNGEGAACATLTLVVPANGVCTPGAFVPCPYSGPPMTAGIGLCQAARDYCNATGTGWLGCAGEVLPSPESCNTPFDDDCDGLANEEGQGCACTPGATAACYTGPAGTAGVGICATGEQTCNPNGRGYGPCLGQVLPQQEICASPKDEDCNGTANCNGAALWSKHFGGGDMQIADGMATDAAGNLFVGGRFYNSADFGGGPLTVDGSLDGFLVKLGPAGNHVWSRNVLNSTFIVMKMAVDASGNTVLTGQTTLYGEQNFVVKLDAAGNHVWSKYVGSTDDRYTPPGVAVDSGGNVLLTVSSNNQEVDFGGGLLTCESFYKLFVVKLDAAGNHVWSKCFGGGGDSRVSDVAVDNGGNVLLTGDFSGSIDFGGGPLTNAVDPTVFVAKLDAAGNYVWSKRFGDVHRWYAPRIAVDNGGNVVLTGAFSGSVDFGGGPLTSPSSYYNVFVAKLNAAGHHVWSKRFGDSWSEGEVPDPKVALDSGGNVVLAGDFSGSVDFGGGPLTGVGRKLFMAKFNAAGHHIWSKRFGDGSAYTLASSVAVDNGGDVVLTGAFYGTADFGNGPLTSTDDSWDVFVAKFTP